MGNKMVRYIETEDEWNKLMEISKEKLVIVHFTAKWCLPCQFVGPKYEAMSEELKEYEFVKLDVDKASLSASRGVGALPTFRLFVDGEKVKEMYGADVTELR